MNLNRDDLLLVMMVIELTDHLPAETRQAAFDELEAAWALHERIYQHKEPA